mmetsp:Transcript_3668/g.496  ORF Transcript_3668/g.496 Transcript_3668/m.496 type:complete len:107 (-) Transcript_3668:441-761(-)
MCICTKLRPHIYLPNDYIIYKDDIGEEMYFIIEGVVNILSPDNNSILKRLTKGDYVGELALLTENRRICSVVAFTHCLMSVLSKSDFDKILESFPEIRTILNQEGS